MGLNFGGGIFSEEDGFLPTPKSNQEMKEFSGFNAYTQGITITLYTVPAGKRFFISSTTHSWSAYNQYTSSTYRGGTGYTKANGVTIFATAGSAYDGQANATGGSTGFSAPVEVNAGQTIQAVFTTGSYLSAMEFQVTVQGWEE
jgi:hypothetical protein